MRREELLSIYERHYNPTLGRLFDISQCPVEYRAEGSTLFDEDGNSYLDFSAGYGVFSIGHVNAFVQAAVQNQLAIMPTAPPLSYNARAAELMHKISLLLPSDLSRVFLAGSGSEAIEIALRAVACANPTRSRLIAATNSYHGKTLGALSIMGQDHLRLPFAPLWNEVQFVSFGDAEAMARAVGDGAAAVFLEPILGGGYITVPPDGYLTAVREVCDRTETPLVIDEVQTGFGRTGTMFAFEHDNIVPDIVILSKGMTGGHAPIAAAVMNDRLAQTCGNAESASGSGAELFSSPMICAAASAAIDFIVDHDLPARAKAMGGYLMERLRYIVKAYPSLIMDCPGRGLMAGIKLRNSILESAVWMQLRKRKVITGLSTNYRTPQPVLRLFPPLTVECPEIDTAIQALDDSLKELKRVPTLPYDLANKAFKIQNYLPRAFLRLGVRLLCPR
jgi:putrescine aminotransferase